MTEYDDMDWLYEVLYAGFNENDLEKQFIDEYAYLLEPGISILDASCGNGIQAVALAKKGFDISASDISERMIELTKKRATKSKVKINTFVSDWKNLQNLNEKYDLIFCYGNSISHSMSKNDRIENIEALKRCLTRNGKIIIETRNWDLMTDQKYTIYNEREYCRKKYLPIYIWEKVEIGQKCTVMVIFVESSNGNFRTYEKELSFNPFLHKDIIDEANKLGLQVINDNFKNNLGNYSIVFEIKK